MPTLFYFISPHAFWTLQKWLNCQLLVEEVLERRVEVVKRTKLECKWYVDEKLVLEERWSWDFA